MSDGSAEVPPTAEERVALAQQSAAPWWRISRWVAWVNLAVAVVVLVVVVAVQLDDGTLIDRRGFLTLGAAVVTPFAAAAVVLCALAVWLIRRRHPVGLVELTCYGVLVGAVLAQWLLVLLDKNAPSTGVPLFVLSFVVLLAAVTAAIVGAAALGRTMRVAKARRAIGVRQF